MPPRSKIYDLPQDLREELNERLVNTGFQDYDGLTDWLEERGFKLSRSAVHRYGRGLQEEFEEAMDATARIVQDQLLRITIAMRKAEHEPEKAAKHLSSVTRALADIGRVSLGQKKWARELRQEVAREAADAAETSLASQGMTRESIDAIKRDILGIA
jgi:2,4-dienoyl-CoA reductase-like NADH-dependent reductase (Old Yellow Enzyme family)